MKIVICIPAQDMVHTTFMNDLIQLIFYTHNGTTRTVEITQMNGCYLDLLRNQLITSALKMNPDYILMLDTDMRFPRDTAARLIRANQEVIGCNYTRRRPPFDPISCTFEDPNKRLDPLSVSGIGPVSILPTGIMMIKPSIFQRIKYPWFENVWRKSDNRLVGEDVIFCAKVQQEAKTQVFCEHDLSREVAHSGQMDFTIPMICEGRI